MANPAPVIKLFREYTFGFVVWNLVAYAMLRQSAHAIISKGRLAKAECCVATVTNLQDLRLSSPMLCTFGSEP